MPGLYCTVVCEIKSQMAISKDLSMSALQQTPECLFYGHLRMWSIGHVDDGTLFQKHIATTWKCDTIRFLMECLAYKMLQLFLKHHCLR